MDRVYCITQLERHRDIFKQVFTGLTPEDIRWKPAPEKWCLLEVLCHLHDEEREDFRARLKHILETPEEPMPKIDPVAWVAEREYMQQDFAAMLGKFLGERDRSIAWLRGLKDPKWSNAYQHPKVGPVSCDLILVNWVAHDLLHLRQITKLRYEKLPTITSEPLDYAGAW